ncbi:MAG: hypothetical protein CR986_02815 [Ignavibacteriae bacterium]|nr:MAG: hypothetical protein CR986_02815 [Ignavibacteriota bacterium]
MILSTNTKHWLIEQAAFQKSRTAVKTSAGEFSFSKLIDFSLRASNFLKENKIKKNNKVAILTNNSIEFIVTINALWFIGAIPVLINYKATESEISEQTDYLNIKYLISFNSTNNIEIANIKKINFTLITLAKYTNQFVPLPFLLRNKAAIMYTSGSTNKPKCVEFTFKNLFESVRQMDKVVNQTIYDTWLALLPFYHIGGFSIIIRSLITGTKIIIPKTSKIEDIITEVRLNHPSLISVVPILFKKILNNIEKPWKKLRVVFVGGAPIQKRLIHKALKNYWPIYVVYGSTETASMITMCSPENIIKNGLSAGRPFEGVEVTINDKNGLVTITSNSVANAYILSNGKRKSLASTFNSNDLGKIDQNNNLHILGRNDDIIISGGRNISLKEIEEKLLKKFKRIKLIGVKDLKWEQSYIIVTDLKEEKIKEELNYFIRKNFSGYKQPQNIFIVDKIPYNEMGKLNKELLKEIINVDFL